MKNPVMTLKRGRTRIAIGAVLGFCLPFAVWAQDQGSLSGTVTDTSGAAVPGAKLAISNSDKGFKRNLVSNSEGEYTARAVPLGSYEITAEAPGFRKLVRTGINLDAGQTLRVDLRLDIGAAAEQVTVAGNLSKVETENGTVSDVIKGQQVLGLGIEGRNFMSLTTLIPGAAATNSFSPGHVGFGSSQLYVSFNGGRVNDNNVEVDGGNNSDIGGGGRNVVTFPNVDSIAEFRISTSGYGADGGERPGALVEVVTKSGTKDFHGTAFEFVRNSVFDANNFFINRQIIPGGGKAPRQPLKWNLFGYNLGGPVYWPHHYNTDKNRTFFFWSESWNIYREGTVVNSTVPTLLMRQGNFSQCDKGSPNFNPIVASNCTVPKNQTTGLPYPGDVVPVDPNAAAILSGLVPLPNNGPTGYVSAPSLPNNYRQENVRVDQNIDDKTSVFVRFTQEDHPFLQTFSTYDTTQLRYGLTTKSATVHLNRNFKPNLQNELILGFENDWQHYVELAGPTSPAQSVLKPAAWTAGSEFPANAMQQNGRVLPYVSVSGGLPFSFSMNTGQNGVSTYSPSATLKDNVTYGLGKHILKFGVFFLDYHATNYNSLAPPQGSLTFNASGPLTTGNALADMYLGKIQQYTEGTPYQGGVATGGWGLVRNRMKNYAVYLQDDWKVTPRLTLNLGLRLDHHGAWYEASSPTQAADFVPGQYNPGRVAQIDASGHFVPGTGLNNTTYGNGLVQCGVGGVPDGCVYPTFVWEPRFGFAYDLTGAGKTVIRGGYGIYSDVGYGHSPNITANSGSPPTGLAPVSFNVNGYQNISVGGLLGPASFTAFGFNNKPPQIHEFNLTIEHQFPGNNFLRVAYVGSLSRHLDASQNINQVPLNSGMAHVPALAGTYGCDAAGNCDVQNILIHTKESSIYFVPYTGFGKIRWAQETANANYNSLQVNYRHAISHGMVFQATYTWERALDDISDGNTQLGVDDLNNLKRWYGLSDNNRSHVMELNYIYDLPVFKNSSNRFVKTAFAGWQLSGVASFFTGQPIDFNCTEAGYGTGIGTSARCNPAGAFKASKGVTNDPRYGPTVTWFDPTTIAMANLSQYSANGEPGMFGYLGRNVLVGPGRNNWDMALLKTFSLPWFRGDHSTLQFRWETYNTFNHTQWQTVQAGCGSNTPFGATCSGNQFNLGNGEVTSAWAPRQMQLGLKFLF